MTSHRILRNFRSMTPSKFHDLNQRVATSLADKTRFPDSIWAANPELLTAYLVASAKHDSVYHESMLGSKVVIAEREVLQGQLVIQLDEIASLLEMSAVRNPDILIASGFDLTKDKRSSSRGNAAAAARTATQAGQKGEGSDTPA